MNDELSTLRKRIDELDGELLRVLAERMRVVREIGVYKKGRGIKPLDEKRWLDLLQSNLSKAASLGLSEEFVKRLYKIIHEYSLEIEIDNT